MEQTIGFMGVKHITKERIHFIQEPCREGEAQARTEHILGREGAVQISWMMQCIGCVEAEDEKEPSAEGLRQKKMGLLSERQG